MRTWDGAPEADFAQGLGQNVLYARILRLIAV